MTSLRHAMQAEVQSHNGIRQLPLMNTNYFARVAAYIEMIIVEGDK